MGSVRAAGNLHMDDVVPSVLKVLGMVIRSDASGPRHYSVQSARERLVRKGLLKYTASGFVSLTRKGEAALRQFELHEYKLQKPARWDEMWRLLIFDIREERKGLRDKVRRTLIAIGFVRLQYSVWAYPYDCEDLVTLLKADFRVGKEVLYLIVDKIENDRWLRKRFGL